MYMYIYEPGIISLFFSAGFKKSGSSWLKLVTTTVGWHDAKQGCEDMDVGSLSARLVVIKSQTKQVEVENYLNQWPGRPLGR